MIHNATHRSHSVNFHIIIALWRLLPPPFSSSSELSLAGFNRMSYGRSAHMKCNGSQINSPNLKLCPSIKFQRPMLCKKQTGYIMSFTTESTTVASSGSSNMCGAKVQSKTFSSFSTMKLSNGSDSAPGTPLCAFCLFGLFSWSPLRLFPHFK